MAGFFSSVVCKTVSSVTALAGCAKEAIKIGRKSFGGNRNRGFIAD
jgi:hypothetical protein